MKSIVLISAAGDEAKARKLVDGLHALGLDFWWEHDVPATPDALARMNAAQCTVLFMSRASLANDAFLSLALKAFHKGKAIGARLDGVAAPESLRPMTVVDVRRFKGNGNDLFLADLRSAANAKAKGIDPPPPRGPVSRATKQMIAGSIAAFAFISLTVGFISDVFGASSGFEGFVSRFDQAQEKAYRQATTCAALREFKHTFQSGFYVDEAERRLRNAITTQELRPFASEQRLDSYLQRAGQPASSNAAAARGIAMDRTKVLAQDECREAAEQLSARVVSSQFVIAAEGLACDPTGSGVVCSAQGKSVCQLEVMRPTVREDCGVAD